MVVPATVRKKISLQKEMEVAFDWVDLVKELPVEDAKIDENGHYDSQRYSEFHD